MCCSLPKIRDSGPGGFSLQFDRGATFLRALSAISVKLSFISVFDITNAGESLTCGAARYYGEVNGIALRGSA